MKLKDIEGLLPEPSLKGSCDTCEHEDDSSNEYCGGCASPTSAWTESRYIKDKRLEQIGEKELEIDVEKVRNELQRIMLAKGYREQDGWEIETLAQAIAKADIIKVKP